jgi:hypothetical protein
MIGRVSNVLASIGAAVLTYRCARAADALVLRIVPSAMTSGSSLIRSHPAPAWVNAKKSLSTQGFVATSRSLMT